jgi:hypothetical protein
MEVSKPKPKKPELLEVLGETNMNVVFSEGYIKDFSEIAYRMAHARQMKLMPGSHKLCIFLQNLADFCLEQRIQLGETEFLSKNKRFILQLFSLICRVSGDHAYFYYFFLDLRGHSKESKFTNAIWRQCWMMKTGSSLFSFMPEKTKDIEEEQKEKPFNLLLFLNASKEEFLGQHKDYKKRCVRLLSQSEISLSCTLVLMWKQLRDFLQESSAINEEVLRRIVMIMKMTCLAIGNILWRSPMERIIEKIKPNNYKSFILIINIEIYCLDQSEDSKEAFSAIKNSVPSADENTIKKASP